MAIHLQRGASPPETPVFRAFEQEECPMTRTVSTARFSMIAAAALAASGLAVITAPAAVAAARVFPQLNESRGIPKRPDL